MRLPELALTLGAAALLAAPASAQLNYAGGPTSGAAGLRVRNNLLYGVNPYRGAISPYEFGYARSYGFNVYNPQTGGSSVFRYTQSQPFGGTVVDVGGTGLPQMSFRATQVNPYFAGGGGGAYVGPNAIAIERARQAQQGGGVRPANGGAVAPGAGQPGGFAAVPPAPAANQPPPASLDKIRSGEALDALAADIGKLLDGGAKSDAPLFPADLLAQVRYQPGPVADLLAALRDGKPELPAALGTPAFTVLRSELPPLVDAVANAVLAGKRPDPTAAERLTARTAKARAEVEPLLKDGAATDRDTVARYFASLDTLAGVSKNQDLAGAYSPAFASIGATATELVKYVRAHKLKFAPAPDGGEAAYLALYRGLSLYKQALESGK